MNVLLTGANGYVGKRLLPVLLESGHKVFCVVRDRNRFNPRLNDYSRVETVEGDFTDPGSFGDLSERIDAAYYLIHSMSSSIDGFEELEKQTARNFGSLAERLGVRQVIFLSGIVNTEKLSRHLSSRKAVEEILSSGDFQLTIIKAGIIVGSGSASFEIIRDLVEKLPVMVTPRWVLTRTQPVAIRDVVSYLTGVLGKKEFYNHSYEIGGEDVLSYREMLLRYAEVRGLKRYIYTLPFMTPRLSSYWLYFVTSVSYPLAVNLVNSMKTEVIVRDNRLEEMLKVSPLGYREAIEKAFLKIEQNLIISSWKDSMVSSSDLSSLEPFIEIPVHGCFHDRKKRNIQDRNAITERIWALGGDKGWYYANFLWEIRGFLDKVAGGVGLRRGRTHPTEIAHGDSLDFWRVLYADREKPRLLLYAEMKLPGEAWLEFRIDDQNILHQTATFRPRGVWGRLYWLLVFPFHLFVFRGMINSIAGNK